MGNMEEKEIIQNRITNLISLRQNATQSLTVLIGGVVGLFFTPNCTVKFIAIAIGFPYILVLR